MVVLDRNPLDTPPAEVKFMKVRKVILGGLEYRNRDSGPLLTLLKGILSRRPT